MARYFTVEQAGWLLPEIQRLLVRAREARMRLESEEDAIEELDQSLTAIQEYGAHVKDLDAGVVDFPTRYLGSEAILCYRLGDSGISHWHALDDGDQMRRRIDQRFLEHHSGTAIQ